MVIESLGLYDRLRVFRRRLRWLLAWRWGAIGGFAGLLVAILMDLLDWFGLLLVPPSLLLVPISTGLVVGFGYALLRPLPPEVVALMIDHRGNLKDRVQTALERAKAEGVFDQPLLEDALSQMEHLRPKRLFAFRVGAWQGAFAGALVALLIVHYLPFLPFLLSDKQKEERKQVQSMAKQVEQVAKPIMEEAKKPDANEIAKRIARNVDLYAKRAQQGRMDKKEALLKMNQILAEAQKLERQNRERLVQTAMKNANAAEQLQKAQEKQLGVDKQMQALTQRMAEIQRQLESGQDANGRPLNSQQRVALQSELQSLKNTLLAMQNPSNMQMMESQMANLQQQMADLQRQLQSGKDNQGIPLSKEAMEALKEQMKSLQQQMRALQLSKEAREFLRKLFNDPNFIEAMKRLQELAKKCQSCNTNQDLQQRKLTAQEIEQMAKELEKMLDELAKKYNSDEAIRELAKQILEEVKNMKQMARLDGA